MLDKFVKEETRSFFSWNMCVTELHTFEGFNAFMDEMVKESLIHADCVSELWKDVILGNSHRDDFFWEAYDSLENNLHSLEVMKNALLSAF
jgi:hypothetical protein